MLSIFCSIFWISGFFCSVAGQWDHNTTFFRSIWRCHSKGAHCRAGTRESLRWRTARNHYGAPTSRISRTQESRCNCVWDKKLSQKAGGHVDRKFRAGLPFPVLEIQRFAALLDWGQISAILSMISLSCFLGKPRKNPRKPEMQKTGFLANGVFACVTPAIFVTSVVFRVWGTKPLFLWTECHSPLSPFSSKPVLGSGQRPRLVATAPLSSSRTATAFMRFLKVKVWRKFKAQMNRGNRIESLWEGNLPLRGSLKGPLRDPLTGRWQISLSEALSAVAPHRFAPWTFFFQKVQEVPLTWLRLQLKIRPVLACPFRTTSDRNLQFRGAVSTGFFWGEVFLLTVGAFLLTVKLLCLQSLKALIRRTFPL